MVTSRNFSMSQINSGHHNLPTYEMSLKLDNVEFVRYCGGHFGRLHNHQIIIISCFNILANCCVSAFVDQKKMRCSLLSVMTFVTGQYFKKKWYPNNINDFKIGSPTNINDFTVNLYARYQSNINILIYIYTYIYNPPSKNFVIHLFCYRYLLLFCIFCFIL